MQGNAGPAPGMPALKHSLFPALSFHLPVQDSGVLNFVRQLGGALGVDLFYELRRLFPASSGQYRIELYIRKRMSSKLLRLIHLHRRALPDGLKRGFC